MVGANLGNRSAADVRLTVQAVLDDAISGRIEGSDLDRIASSIQRAQAKLAQHTGIMPGSSAPQQPLQAQPTGRGPIGGAAQQQAEGTLSQTPIANTERPEALAEKAATQPPRGTASASIPAYRQPKA